MSAKFGVPLVLALAILACGGAGGPPATATSEPPPEESFGYFNCFGRSSALFAGAFSIRPGGTANFNGQEGTWTYDSSAGALNFSAAISVATAHVDADTGELDARLRPGLVLPHVEDERMTCKPGTEPGPAP